MLLLCCFPWDFNVDQSKLARVAMVAMHIFFTKMQVKYCSFSGNILTRGGSFLPCTDWHELSNFSSTTSFSYTET